MKARPVIVCLIGSTRFKMAYEIAMREETLAGKIVLTVGMFGHIEGIDMDGPIKTMLDELHLRKIDIADEVLVINAKRRRCPVCRTWYLWCANTGNIADHELCDCFCHKHLSPLEAIPFELVPYIGDSTKREIAYAQMTAKLVRYLVPQ